ncbi:MAG TPA: succinic semialdehyde dehydrogenase [Nocardioidaceae bacterium]|nr:succinic semialdehyde dehydrogenase [Nocardioidaceae bacterium]
MSIEPSPEAAAPPDPEHDPTASYAIDPALVRRLVARLTASDREQHTTYAPFTEQPIAVLALSSSADVQYAAAAARAAQRSWARVPLSRRAEVFLDFHDLVLDRQDALLDLIQWESGKARKNAFEEVAHVAMTARYYARLAHAYLEPQRRLGIFPLLTRIDVRRQPKGLVGVISPWNYPLTMAVADAIPAVVAGNAVMHKPDQQTPLSALYAIDLLIEAGMPADLWQVVYGEGSVVGPAVIDEVDYICFTGSTDTGRQVATQAASRLIGASLELGGKNPMLVLRDADLDRAADGAVRACFSSAGQLCVSMERLYVADQIFDRFVDRLVRRTEAMRLSPALDFSADMGSMISATQVARTQQHVDDARSRGAEVLTGGRTRPEAGPLFYEPTVLTGVQPGMACFADETFGPVVSLYRFTDERDAVVRANDGEYGLNASIWTRDAARGRAIAAQIRCGTVNVNEGYAPTFGSIDAPMGGMRQSGLGRRQGPDGIHRFTDVQAIATQRVLPIAPAFGMSDRVFATAMTGALRVLKAVRRP